MTSSNYPKSTVIQDDFKVDKSIIRHLIFSQAGSLYKAILELAMNSLDAKASNIAIDISSDMKKVTVVDDGVGFHSIEEIKKLFGTFGFDHQTEQEIARGRHYGRFGLGRAQCLAFGSTIWSTNHFRMEVDLKENNSSNLPYTITHHEQVLHKGCKIEISLYETMSIHDKRNLVSDLKRMAKYVNENLTVDGVLVNEVLSERKWTAINDDFFFLKAPSERGLTIYNKGVYVTTYPHSKFGVSGDLVSRKENFEVNMARNDVLQSSCNLWKLIPSFVKPFTIKRTSKKLSDEDRVYLLAQVLQGKSNYQDIRSKRIFQNADGKYFSLKQLCTYAQGNVTIAPSRYDQYKGHGLHQKGIAFCLSYDFLDKHGFQTLDEFILALKESSLIITDYEVKLDDLKHLPFTTAVETVSDQHDILPLDELSPIDKARFNATKIMCKQLYNHKMDAEIRAGRYDTDDIQSRHTLYETLKIKHERRLTVGVSEISQAWTDGKSYIAIDIKTLRSSFERGLNGIFNLLLIIGHELCHDESTNQTHDHDATFYERFHDMVLNDQLHLFTIAAYCLEIYMNENKKINRQLNARETKNTFNILERLYKKTF